MRFNKKTKYKIWRMIGDIKQNVYGGENVLAYERLTELDNFIKQLEEGE